MVRYAKPLHGLNRQELEEAWTKIVGQPPPVTAPKRMMIEALSACSKIELNELTDAGHEPERGPQ